MTPVSLVVPVYDEERRLPALLDTLAGPGADDLAAAGLDLAEVVVVDDGSRDGTSAVLSDERRLPLRTVRLERNRGKGAAVRAGMLEAASPLALLTDVDLSTPLADAARLVERLDEGFDVVIGSRALPESDLEVRQPAPRELAGKAFNVVLRALTRLPFRDTQCGFKLFRLDRARRLFELQRIDGYVYDAEILVLARRLGLSVAEVPVRWADVPGSKVHPVRSSLTTARDLVRVARLAHGGGAPLAHVEAREA